MIEIHKTADVLTDVLAVIGMLLGLVVLGMILFRLITG